jgi:hypothetical protein
MMNDSKTTNTYALSIRQPWAELILSGKKTLEIRSWSTDYRGLLWVHVGLKSDPELERAFGLTNLFRGGYIGTVVLGGVIPLDEDDWVFYRSKHLDLSRYQPNHYGWFLESPLRFATPIPGPGKLGLYHPSEDVVALLKSASRTE